MNVKLTAFDRQYRTASSEGYNVRQESRRIARLDLHFTTQSVYATLVLLEDLAEEEVLTLIERIDESLVLSAETPREDFVVTVFRGEETGFYSDDFQAERGRQVSIRPGARLDRDLTDDADS